MRAWRRHRILDTATFEVRLRQDGAMAGTATTPGQGQITFRRADVAGLDGLLPARTGPFLAAVVAIAALFWGAGWALAADRTKFLGQREWWVGPAYLAVHVALLRLFRSEEHTS